MDSNIVMVGDDAVMKNFYEVLGVDKDATDEEVKAAYRRKAQKAHPDKGGDEEQFKVLQEAYEMLKDSASRESYNAKLTDPLLERAVGILMQIFNLVLNENKLGDMIEFSKTHVANELNTRIASRKMHGKKIKALKSKLNRIVNKKKSKDNMFDVMLMGLIDQERFILRQLNDEVEVLKRVKKLIGEYEDTKPDKQNSFLMNEWPVKSRPTVFRTF